MKQILILLLLSTQIIAQDWHNECSDEGFLEIEENGEVTELWIEGAYFNCYGTPHEKWHEFKFTCHGEEEGTLFKVPFGDTLRMEIGKEPVVVTAASKYRRYAFTYGTYCPSVCITGNSDTCFSEHVEDVAPLPQETYFYNTSLGTLTVFSEEGFEMLLLDQMGAIILHESYPSGEVVIQVNTGAMFAVLAFNSGHVKSFTLV